MCVKSLISSENCDMINIMDENRFGKTGHENRPDFPDIQEENI